MEIWEVFRETLLITGFVSVMMMAVEYANVYTRGAWRRMLGSSIWRQYLLAAALGAVPGCLGTFVVVAMYTHRMVSLGTVVVAMMASTGDEGFVMFALFPKQAALLTLGQMVIGIGLGWLVDGWRGTKGARAEPCCDGLAIHDDEPHVLPHAGRTLENLKRPSAARGVLLGTLFVFGAALVAGEVGPEEWEVTRVLLVASTAFGLWLVATVSEHFLTEHLYDHVLRQHLPKIFLWTAGALGAMALLGHYVSVEQFIGGHRWGVLIAGSIIGVVPQSGPHLIFTTLYAKGAMPLSVLVANTMVQDGHGLLPLLAASRMDFVRVKGVCLVAGLAVGVGMMAAGW